MKTAKKGEIKLHHNHRDIQKIWMHIDDYLSSGETMDRILDLGEPYSLFFADHFQRILGYGATPSKLFKLNEPWYKENIYHPEYLLSVLQVFMSYGLDKAFIKNWLEQNVPGTLFVAYQFDEFGIDASYYREDFFEGRSFDEVWGEDEAIKVWVDVTPEEVIRHYPIAAIRESYRYRNGHRYSGFAAFVDKYLERKGDINLLAEHFLKECGYLTDEEGLVALTLMRVNGAEAVDANQIIDSLLESGYINKGMEEVKEDNFWFFEMLKPYADAEHLAKITL